MIRRPTYSVDVLPGNLIVAAAILVVLPIIGTAGYMVLEGWSFLDALYMTIITLTTVGFREVRELDDSGRIFTMLLIISGVGAILYAFLAVFQFVLEGELGLLLGRQRMKSRIDSLKGHYILCGFGRVGERWPGSSSRGICRSWWSKRTRRRSNARSAAVTCSSSATPPATRQ